MPIHSSSERVEQYLKDTAFANVKGEEPTKLYYGVELEVEVGSTRDAVSVKCEKDFEGYALLKYEPSINAGFEIVTVPATLRFHREKLWNKFFKNSAAEVKASGNTGMHIHFSRDGVEDKQLAKALYFVHETTNSGFLSDIAGRRVFSGATWCTQRKKKYDGTKENDSSILAQETHSRTAMSVSCHNNSKTVECRIFRSNPTYEGVVQALEFMDALLLYCKDCGETEKDLSSKGFTLWFDSENKKDDYPYLWNHMVNKNWLKDRPTTMDNIKGLVKVFLKQAA